MCQLLSITDKDRMSIFINGLSSKIKNYVILYQPDSFEKAASLPVCEMQLQGTRLICEILVLCKTNVLRNSKDE